jgi:hypothetical protein
VVKYFELFRFDRRTKRLIPFKIASLEDFHSQIIMRSHSFPAEGFLCIGSAQRAMSKSLNISKACSRGAQSDTLSIERTKHKKNETPFFDPQVPAARKKFREIRYRIAQRVIHNGGQTESSSRNSKQGDTDSDLSTERGPCKIDLNSRDSGHCIHCLTLRDAMRFLSRKSGSIRIAYC